MKKIKIGITDDDALIVDLLKSFFSNQKEIEVMLTANSGDELKNLLKSNIIPEVLLLDLKMKETDGIEITHFLKEHFPSIKIIVISSHYQNSFLGFMLKTGANAFLPKGISPIALTKIIHAVNETGVYFLDDQLEIVRQQISSRVPKPVFNDSLLTEREKEVLKLICLQKTAKEIGELLFIAPRTVEGHKNNLFVKTGAKNIAGLVVYAIQHSILKIEELPLL